MKTEPLAMKVERRLTAAARALGTANPVASTKGLLQRTFSLPEGDERYAANTLAPMAAPFEPSFSARQPALLRFTIEPLPPDAASIDRRDEATREMRRLLSQLAGRNAVRWFDNRSEPWRGFCTGGRLNYGAYFGTNHDRDGLTASKVYYEMQPGQVGELPPRLVDLTLTATSALPGLVPVFTTIAAGRDGAEQRVTFVLARPLRLADLGPMLDALGLGNRLPGIMQTVGLVLGGRFDLPPHACMISLTDTADGPEFEISVMLSAIADVPINFLSLLTLGLSERPRELAALERWMTAFTPEDDVWPGRFSTLSLRTSRTAPPRVSLSLRPIEFELPLARADQSVA